MGCRIHIAFTFAAAVASAAVATAQPVSRIGYVNFDNDPRGRPAGGNSCIWVNCNGLMFCVTLAMPLTLRDDDVRDLVQQEFVTGTQTGVTFQVVPVGDTGLIVVSQNLASGGTAVIDNLDCWTDDTAVIVFDSLVASPALFIDVDEADLGGTPADSTIGTSTVVAVNANGRLVASATCSSCDDNGVANLIDSQVRADGNFAIIRDGNGTQLGTGIVLTGRSLDDPITTAVVSIGGDGIGGDGKIPPSIKNFDPTLAPPGGPRPRITVQGDNFVSPTLTIGGLAANIVSSDPNTIVADIPADPNNTTEAVDIEVRNADGLTHRLIQQFEYSTSIASTDLCRSGNVFGGNATGDGLAEVLFINGTTGRPLREITVAANERLRIDVKEPPGTLQAHFALYAYTGTPMTGDPTSQVFLGETLGTMCKPTPLNAVTPFKCFVSNAVIPAAMRCGNPRNIRAPFTIATRLRRAGLVFFLQGFIEDNNAPAPTQNFSVMNGIVLRSI
jgi:IPT/TIG domain-containing protein